MENNVELTKLSEIGEYFSLTTQEVKRIMLEVGNRECAKLLYFDYESSIYYSSSYLFEKIKEVDDNLKNYIFNEEDVIKTGSDCIPFNPCPTVYFLLRDGEIIYIGKTLDLAGRISSHLKDKYFDKIASYTVLDKNRLGIIENVNIRYYNPKLNISIMNDGEYFRAILNEIDLTCFEW